MNARVGLDIGGTKTAVLIVDEAGQALGEFVQPTDVATPERLVAGVVAAVDRALTTAGATRPALLAAGVGVPGQVDPQTGTVSMAVNLNLRRPYPLRDALQTALGVPVTLENDVRTAAWGAYHRANNARPIASLAYLSIGTGIAAGLVLGGRLYRGAAGMAGEIGHIPVDPSGPRCVCGSYGCLEVFAAGPAIAAYAAGKLSAPDGSALSTGQIYDLAARGDPAAGHIVSRAASYLARAVYLLVMAYDVEQVALGGGVTRAGEAFERPLRQALSALRADSPLAAAMLPDEKIVVVPADFNAGVVGAVYLTENDGASLAPRR
jgi:glucokinase